MISMPRLRLLAGAFVFMASVVFVRTVSFYFVRATDQDAVVGVPVTPSQFKPLRGMITDRVGAVLATSQTVYRVRAQLRVAPTVLPSPTLAAPAPTTNATAQPKLVPMRLTMTNTQAVANAIAPVLGAQPAVLKAKLDALKLDYEADRRSSTLLAANLSVSQTYAITKTLETQKLSGIEIEETTIRTYPQGDVAGPLLGFVSLEPRGYGGVEGYYEQRLRGTDGMLKRRAYLDLITATVEAEGATIELTLDMTLQRYAEQRLAQALSTYKARSGAIIVMDSQTGAIYASVSLPGFNPAQASEIARDDISRLRDSNVSDVYEPGSVMKLVTIAAALDAGTVTPRSVFNDTGRFDAGGVTILNNEGHRFGRVNLEQVLEHSVNVVSAQIAKEMTAPVFYDYLERFGYGQRTGVDLADESPGFVRTQQDKDWTRVDLATNSFGQGIAVSPLQLLNTINVIANDGMLLQPYVVQQVRYADGKVETRRPVNVREVIKPETARHVREIAARATAAGTPKAIIPGFTVAGKTGTANWYQNMKKASTTIQTFVGMVPASRPRLTILVKLDEPAVQYARDSAVPVFRDVAERAAQILGVPPDSVK